MQICKFTYRQDVSKEIVLELCSKIYWLLLANLSLKMFTVIQSFFSTTV